MAPQCGHGADGFGRRRGDQEDRFLAQPAIVEATPSPTARESALEGKCILVVDDDQLVRINTSAMVEELGHTVIEAASAKEALQLLRKTPGVDLVVTDHAMPVMTGAELAATLKTERPNLPVLIVTGYAELPEDADPTLPKLGKPFGLTQLEAAIAQQLGGRT
jgi:CheY-like chemotaxis protein